MKVVGKLVWVLLAVHAGSALAAGPATLMQLEQRAQARGYRVREFRWDPVLQQRWAVLESLAHPERPLLSELTDTDGDVPAAVAAADSTPVRFVPVFKAGVFKAREFTVRSGDRVIVWSAEENVRMQMAAVAEGNAAIGEPIELRVTGAGMNGDMGWRVTGTVRGPGSVEMQR